MPSDQIEVKIDSTVEAAAEWLASGEGRDALREFLIEERRKCEEERNKARVTWDSMRQAMTV